MADPESAAPGTAATGSTQRRGGTENPLRPLSDDAFRQVCQHLRTTAIVAFDRDLRHLSVVGGASHTGQWARSRLEGHTLVEVLDGEEREFFTGLYRRVLDGAVEEVADYRSPVDGRHYWLQAAPVSDRRGRVTGGMLITRDVTSAHRAAEELAMLRRRFQVAFDNAPAGTALVDRGGCLLMVNRHLAQLLGRPVEEVQGTSVFRYVHPDDVASAQATWSQVLRHPGVQVTEERRYLRPDGEPVWVQAHHVLVEDGPKQPEHVVMQCRDVTDQRTAEAALRQMALHDPLTGLGNRTLLLDRLQHALDRAPRHGLRLAVVFCDLDRFKVINDSLGHHVGDEVLVAVAERLRSALRPEDTIARLGGDEFAVVCEDVRDETDARAIADRLVAAVTAAPVHVSSATGSGSPSIAVQVSVGVAVAGSLHREPADLLRDADLAMYAAKAAGPNRVEVLTATLRRTAHRRMTLESALREAVRDGRLAVAYQPIVDLDARRVVGVEALARWTHPVHGPVSPREFVPLADESGLIVELGRFVLRQACADVAAWRADVPAARELGLSVNVSARQLADPHLVEDLRGALHESGLHPTELTLEITENTLMEPAGAAYSTLTSLQDGLGLAFAIDDFGTGYSSLAYLTRLPVQALKVDRGFVDGLAGADAGSSAVVAAVIGLAHTLGLRVTAEGVETPAQAEHLRNLACRYAQGYLYAAPLPATEFPRWLATATL